MEEEEWMEGRRKKGSRRGMEGRETKKRGSGRGVEGGEEEEREWERSG